jgi:hypothetical protein
MVLAERIGKNGVIEQREFGLHQWRILPTAQDGTKEGWREKSELNSYGTIQRNVIVPPEVVQMQSKRKVGRPVTSKDPKNIKRRKEAKANYVHNEDIEIIVKQINTDSNGNYNQE